MQQTPSSKIELKQLLFGYYNGDVKKCEEAYRFFLSDCSDIPEYPIMPPSTMDKAKNIIGDVFSFVKENQADIFGAINMIKNLRSQPMPSVPPSVPPLMKP